MGRGLLLYTFGLCFIYRRWVGAFYQKSKFDFLSKYSNIICWVSKCVDWDSHHTHSVRAMHEIKWWKKKKEKKKKWIKSEQKKKKEKVKWIETKKEKKKWKVKWNKEKILKVKKVQKWSLCRHSILHPWFNQGRWLDWPSMYPKIMIALHALIHSLHIIKWSWDSNCRDSMPYSQIRPLDWKISQDQVFMVCIHCLGWNRLRVINWN